jgi:hypothetical protein
LVDQCFLPEDPCTVDINEDTEPISYSPDAPDSMANAVKMVQPIVDIIFNAFEDQLKTTEKQQQLVQSIVSYAPPYSSMVYPCYPSRTSIQPITLHSVHFNIQLTSGRQPTAMSYGDREMTDNQSSLPNVATRKSDQSLSLSFNDLKQKLISKIVSNTSQIETDEYQFKRMLQLAIVGMSALCGYWFF